MVSLVNTFLSYVMLMLVIVAVAVCGFALGWFLRKRKDSKAAMEAQKDTEE